MTGDNAMTYDAENRISAVAGATYIYDAEGNRVEKQGVGVTDTVYFGGRPLARLAAGQWTDLICFPTAGGPTGLLAEVPGTPTGSPVYRVTDHLGSTVGSLLADGTFVNPTDYTPFGQVFHGSTNDPYLFTGYERDAESGMDYASARHYASNMGRFVSPDPSGLAYASLANPQSFNLYAYALNNPLRYVDPTGLDECQWDGGDKTDPEDGLNTEDKCRKAGGNWFGNTDSKVTVRPDGNSGCLGNCGDDPLDALYALEQSNYCIALQQVQPAQVSSPGLAVVKQIAKRTAWVPTFCSGGVFMVRGKAFEVSEAEVATGVIAVNDSQSGASVGALGEVSGGEGVTGGVGAIGSTEGPEGFAFTGVGAQGGLGHAEIGAGAGVVAFKPFGGGGPGVGVYAEGSAGGSLVEYGAYANVSTMGQCAASHR